MSDEHMVLNPREEVLQILAEADEVVLCDVRDELRRARRGHAPINSAHEGYAVILEELDEFWEEVRRKRSERDPKAMYHELIQTAAMAVRTATDVLRLREGWDRQA